MLGGIFVVWLAASFVSGSGLSGGSKLGGLPKIHDGVDPTMQFERLASGVTGSLDSDATTLARRSLARGAMGLGWPWLLAFAVALVVLLVATAVWAKSASSRARAGRVLVVLAVALACVVAVSIAFGLGWDTYVPRRTGWTRMFQVSTVLVPLAAAIVASMGRSSSRRLFRIVPPAIGIGIAVLVLFHGMGTWNATLALWQPPSDTVAALSALDLPSDAVVLTNGYSEGEVQLTAGGTGVLHGRAPYTEAPLLDRANALLAKSQAFFATPNGPGVSLPCDGITHVLVAVDGDWRLGTSQVFPTDLVALDARPDLHRVATGPGFVLYTVDAGPPSATPTLRCSSASRR